MPSNTIEMRVQKWFGVSQTFCDSAQIHISMVMLGDVSQHSVGEIDSCQGKHKVSSSLGEPRST